MVELQERIYFLILITNGLVYFLLFIASNVSRGFMNKITITARIGVKKPNVPHPTELLFSSLAREEQNIAAIILKIKVIIKTINLPIASSSLLIFK